MPFIYGGQSDRTHSNFTQCATISIVIASVEHEKLSLQ